MGDRDILKAAFAGRIVSYGMSTSGDVIIANWPRYSRHISHNCWRWWYNMNYIKIFDICGLGAICLSLIYGMYLVPESITVGIVVPVMYASVIFLGPSSYKIYIVGIIVVAIGSCIILFALYIPDVILISMLVAVTVRTAYLLQSKGK